jgi:hypothetical protein
MQASKNEKMSSRKGERKKTDYDDDDDVDTFASHIRERPK